MVDDEEIVVEIAQDESLRTVVLTINSNQPMNEAEVIDCLYGLLDDCVAGKQSLLSDMVQTERSYH